MKNIFKMIKKRLYFVISAFLVFLIAVFSVFYVSAKTSQEDNKKYDEFNLFEISNSNACDIDYNVGVPSYYLDGTNGYTNLNSLGLQTYGADDKIGMKVSFTDDVTLKLRQPIYIGDLGLDIPLVELLVAPEDAAIREYLPPGDRAEFYQIILRMQDVENPDLFIEIELHHSLSNTMRTTARASATNVTIGGMRWGTLSTPENLGMPIRFSFCGAENRTVGMYYDSSLNAAYINTDYINDEIIHETPAILRDFDDSTQLLANDIAFPGFTTDVVDLSLTFKGVYGDKASVILMSVAGQQLDGEEFIDNISPSLVIEKDFSNSTLPQGEVGKNFSFFDVKAFDLVDGNLTKNINIDVFKDYGTNQSIKVEKSKYGFIPTTAGNYTIQYSVSDYSGNSSLLTRTITVKDVLDKLDINFVEELPKTVPLGTIVRIPSYQICGGSGNYQYDISVTYQNADNPVEVIENEFHATKQGYYIINVKIKDYLNNTCEKQIFIKCEVDDSPILSKIYFPKAILAHKYYEIPELTAYYNNSSEYLPKLLNTDVYVKENDGEYEKINDNHYFVNSENGQLFIKYKVLFDNEVLLETPEYQISIVSPSRSGHYFYSFDDSIEYKSSSLGEEFENEELFIAKKNSAVMDFINVLSIDSFKISFTVPKKYNNFNSIKLTLTDYCDFDKKVEFKIDKYNDGYVKLNYNGSLYTFDGSISNEKPIDISIRNGVDIYGYNFYLCSFDTYTNGKKFQGFTDNKFYLSISIEGVMGASGLQINNFANQTTFTTELCDYVSPFIVFNKQTPIYQSIGSEYLTPIAYGFDVLDPNINVSLSIKDPDKINILNDYDAKESYKFVFNKYGEYNLIYSASDDWGNSVIRTVKIICLDNFAPVLKIDGRINKQYSLGDTIVLPNCEVEDNVDKDLKFYVFIITPSATIINAEDKYTFVEKGKYVIRYYAQDNRYNYSYYDFITYVK